MLDLLTDNQGEILVDIRAHPGEQPRSSTSDSGHSAMTVQNCITLPITWRVKLFKMAMSQLLNLAAKGSLVLPGRGTEPEACHHRRIADELLPRGCEVRYIVDRHDVRCHHLSS